MRIVLQRVSAAEVSIDNLPHSSIGHGFLILLGIEHDDSNEDIDWLLRKVVQMRVFADEEGKMNKAINDVSGSCLVVSQFTLHASTKKGNRPSFIKAAKPIHAIPLYEQFVNLLQQQVSVVKAGVFGADMQVSLINDGPVTIILDSKDKE